MHGETVKFLHYIKPKGIYTLY